MKEFLVWSQSLYLEQVSEFHSVEPNVIIIKLLVLPLNCFKREIFSRKIPCPAINIFLGYGSGSVVHNMMFLQYLYSGSSIFQIHLQNYETTIGVLIHAIFL